MIHMLAASGMARIAAAGSRFEEAAVAGARSAGDGARAERQPQPVVGKHRLGSPQLCATTLHMRKRILMQELRP